MLKTIIHTLGLGYDKYVNKKRNKKTKSTLTGNFFLVT